MAPISVGELIDKITILELKLEFIKDQSKLDNVRKELAELTSILAALPTPDVLTERDALIAVNRQLWHIEDFKRQCERENKFDEEFVDAARQVYLKNDLRALIKRKINELCGSAIVEEKSH
jgi:hypothetical protein